jgi:subtilase family serine protease
MKVSFCIHDSRSIPLRKALSPGHLFVSALTALAFAFALPMFASSRSLITDKIDEAQLVTLAGNTRPAARNPLNDRGPVDDDLPLDHMLLQLNRSPEKEAELDTLLDHMHQPGSPSFHKWMTAEEFGSQFGASSNDIDTITSWLESHGFTINQVYPNRTLIDFSGNAGEVREAFHIELDSLEVQGEQHVANIEDPQIPAALAPVIHGIVSLNDFRPHAMHKDVMRSHIDVTSGKLMTAEDETSPEYTFKAGGGTYQPLVPGDLETIYNMNPLFTAGYSGQGQTVVVIEDTNLYTTADWITFRKAFGLSKYAAGNLTQVHPGNCTDPGVNGDDEEAILDAEYASASAPSATIEVASCADTFAGFGGLLALENLINTSKTPPAIVSISYGVCEAENGATANATYSATYQQAVAEGVSVFVSSGDEGGASCDAGSTSATHGLGVSAFASTAYNVAVGGTDFGDTYAGTNASYWSPTDSSTYASAKSYIDEIPWDDSCASSLLSTLATRSSVTYGTSGFCNSATGKDYYLTITAGSGGASNCFSGAATIGGVASGKCKGNAKPSWQTGVAGIPYDGVRDIPDVSLFAANGVWGHYYVYCFSDKVHGGTPCSGAPSAWSGGGGTSFASPIMAGIQALVNQKTGARQGNPNPAYYRMAAAEYGSTGSSTCNASKGSSISSTCVFHDVTQGNMDVNCTGATDCERPSGNNGVLSIASNSYKPAYNAMTGYDLATGIGSVNAYNLVEKWSAVNAAVTKMKPLDLR